MSTSGYDFNMGLGVMSWSSKKQPKVYLSFIEAEYKAMSSATCEVVCLRRIIDDVGEKQEEPTKVHCDIKVQLNWHINWYIMHGQSILSCNPILREKRLNTRKLN